MHSRESGQEALSKVEPDARGEGRNWVVRAQDGEAAQVLTEVEAALERGLEPRVRVTALYAQAISLLMLGDNATAVRVARDLTALCRDLGLQAAGLQARALLVELLRREGQLEQAVEQLAHAAALEPVMRDLQDPDVQVALGALAVALRLSGVSDEARRIEERLATVEDALPRHQRVSRWSNLAFEHAVQAMRAARCAPYAADATLLAQAVQEIRRAKSLAGWGSYDVVSVEAAVLAALFESIVGDPEEALRLIEDCRNVMDRGPEATTAQLFWAAAKVRALARMGRHVDAATVGQRVLASVRGSGRDGDDRLILAYEVMRAEHPGCELPGSGTAAFVDLAEQQLGADVALVTELFRARVDILRGIDERRMLAKAASVDPLTGLVNRRGVTTAISDAAARPPDDSVALLLIDLDGFKDVNDNDGHLAGDVVLQLVSIELRKAARLDDMVARWGGDEFVVVAVLDPDRALALADRLRETIRNVEYDGQKPLTGSVGVAVRDNPIDPETWLRRADEAMYAAKRSGGDATVLG